MNIYIESNFILEMVLAQKQHECCHKILMLAESKKVTIILPSFSISECYDAIKQIESKRNSFKMDLQKNQTQFNESPMYEQDSESFDNLISLIDRSNENEHVALNSVILRITKICEIIPLEYAILNDAKKTAEEFGLKDPDAIICASIFSHLRKNCDIPSSLFLNKNKVDFNEPELIKQLNELDCWVLFNFNDGFNRVMHQLERT